MKRVTLQDACERVDYGLATSAVLDGDGPRFLRITDIDRTFVNWDSVPRCEASPEEASKYALETGDIVVARTGASTGRSQWVEVTEPSVFASYLVRFRANSQYDSRFLGYVLSSQPWQDHVASVAHGKSAQPNMSASEMARFSFSCPTLPEQRAIAQVLGAFDDKIAANTKLAETSSTTSQALFQQLIAASSELTTLGELLNLEYGKALPAAKRAHGHVAVYGSGGVVGAHNEALKDGPGIVVGRKGSAGMVYWSPGPFFPIDTTYYVDPKLGSETLPFCYHVLKSLRLAEMNSDSAVPGLNRAEALATKVQKVDYPAISNFCAAAAPLFELAAEYEQENRTLAATRDALLPQLMSGKLRVKDIENTMGEMV